MYEGGTEVGKMRYTMILVAALAFILLAGCLGQAQAAPASNSTSTGSGASAPSQAVGNKPTNANNPSQTNSNSQVNDVAKTSNPIVVFETTKGTFTAEIYVKEAPITGGNFMKLVRSGFYNGLTFHRVVPGFVAQGGDPKGDGSGGSADAIPLEIVPSLKHKIGSLGMARTQDPNSASSQFYVVTGDASFLDGNYAVFGAVQGDGMSVVQKLVVGDKMTKVYEQK